MGKALLSRKRRAPEGGGRSTTAPAGTSKSDTLVGTHNHAASSPYGIEETEAQPENVCGLMSLINQPTMTKEL